MTKVADTTVALTGILPAVMIASAVLTALVAMTRRIGFFWSKPCKACEQKFAVNPPTWGCLLPK